MMMMMMKMMIKTITETEYLQSALLNVLDKILARVCFCLLLGVAAVREMAT